jgi:hypothetical protein
LRRIVFGAVNARIFRTCAERNPGRSRVLRNVKLSLKNHPTLEIREHHGDKIIAVKGCGLKDCHLPEMPPEFMCAELGIRDARTGSVAAILTRMGEILGSCREYRPTFSLVGVAFLIEQLYGSGGQPKKIGTPTDALLEHEIKSIVEQVVQQLACQADQTYAATGKRGADHLALYIKAVRKILEAEFVQGDGDGLSFYGMLQEDWPDLSLPEYRQGHRNALEYLVKLGRQEMRVALERDFPQLAPNDTNILARTAK